MTPRLCVSARDSSHRDTEAQSWVSTPFRDAHLRAENAVVEKGCVSARIQEKGLGNADIRVVEGTSLVKPSLDCVTAHVNVRLIKCHILRGESSAFVLYVLPPDSNDASLTNGIP